MDRRYTASKYRRGRQLRRFLAVLTVVFMISGAIFLTYAKTETDPREQGQTAQTEDDAAAASNDPAEPAAQETEEEASRGEKPVIPPQTEETEDQQAEEKFVPKPYVGSTSSKSTGKKSAKNGTKKVEKKAEPVKPPASDQISLLDMGMLGAAS